MTNIVIVNPSPNMKQIAREIEIRGYKISFVRTTDIPNIYPGKVYYFFGGYNVYFSIEAQGLIDKEDGIFLFKNSFISRFRLGNVEKRLTSINPDLSGGNFTDLLMFRRGVLEYDVKSGEKLKEYANIEAVVEAYPDAVTIAKSVVGNSNVKMIGWETDYDLCETFGNDYFIFFTPHGRIEAFVHEGLLVTVSKSKDHMKALSALNKSLNSFSFKKVYEKGLIACAAPWITENSSPKYFLTCDYSFANASISMPSAWYDKCASFICLNGSFIKLLQADK